MTRANELLFPTLTMGEKAFSLTEMNEIAKCFHTPSVQKYLLFNAQLAIKDITEGQRKEGEAAESYLERLAGVAGGLAVFKTLLEIEPASPAES